MDVLLPLLVFVGCVWGPALALAGGLTGPDPRERLALGVGGAVLGLFFLGFGSHALGLPVELRLVWPLLTVAALWWRRRAVRSLLTESGTMRVLGQWGLFTVWALGLLLCVQSYGGGHWTGDWIEHYERARFFSLGLPPDTRFLYGAYSLAARPPLANAVQSVLLDFSGGGFSRHIVLNTLFGTLLLFPAILLARAWSRKRAEVAAAAVLVVLMLNPMTAQNLLFAWTRHLTSFWVLLGSYLLLRGLVRGDDRTARTMGFLALAAGLLTHYSAAPAVLVWLAAYGWIYRANWRTAFFLRETLSHAAACGALLTIWFGWAFYQLGGQEVLGSNTSVQFGAAQTPLETLRIIALNLRDTLVPHTLRDTPAGLAVPEQISLAGRIRDYCFHLYQVNLPLMFGIGGLGALLLLIAHKSGRTGPWLLAVAAWTVLGVAAFPSRDHLGLGHVCLQPLVLLGLARVAAFLVDGTPVARRIWAAGALVDVAFGIVLSLALQTLRFEPVMHYAHTSRDATRHLANLNWDMPRKTTEIADWLLLALLGIALAWSIREWRKAGAKSDVHLL